MKSTKFQAKKMIEEGPDLALLLLLIYIFII